MLTRPTQHFLDIENLCGTADLYPEIVTSTFADYLQVTKAAPHDLFTVSTSHHNQKVAAFALRAIRSLHLLPPRSGPDGADMALIDGIAAARMNKGIDRICIGSGDHIFAFALARLNNLGFHTTAKESVNAQTSSDAAGVASVMNVIRPSENKRDVLAMVDSSPLSRV